MQEYKLSHNCVPELVAQPFHPFLPVQFYLLGPFCPSVLVRKQLSLKIHVCGMIFWNLVMKLKVQDITYYNFM